jgi:hypothetical protein
MNLVWRFAEEDFMIKFAMLAVSTLLAVAAFADESAVRQITCTSNDTYTECETGTMVFNPHVYRQLSREDKYGNGACEFDRDWGTVATRFWTNHGCSAIFEFSTTGPIPPPPQPTPAPTPEPTPCPTPHDQTLSCEWNGLNWQPYTYEWSHFIGTYRYGFAQISDCQSTLAMAKEDIVCNWDGRGFSAYEIVHNLPLGYSHRTLEACYAHAH